MTMAFARPFAAVGGLLRVTTSMFFARGGIGFLQLWRGRVNYRAEIGDPATNSIVGAVVGWISRNFPEAPVRVVLENDPKATPIVRSNSGPGRMLRLLEHPNRWFSGVVMWMATIVDFVIDGNAYWIKVRAEGFAPGVPGPVIELWWVPQRQMEPRWPLDDPNVFIGWYQYTVDGTAYRVEVQDVVHFRNGIDPDNPRKGKAPLKAVFREIYTDEEASLFTASLLHNLGVPGVVIAPSNTNAGQRINADTEAVKQRFMDKFGGDHRGEPLVFSAPTDVKVLSFNPQQMELRELRRIPEERIAAVLGVPPGTVGLGAGLDRNTLTNYPEGNRAAYTQGVIPNQRLIAAELEVQLLPDFVSDPLPYDVFFDASVTAAMSEAVGEVWKRAESSAIKGLITRAEFKRRTGQAVATDGSDDVYIYPNNFVITAADDGGLTPPVVRAAPPAQLPSGQQAVALLGSGMEERHCTQCGRNNGAMAEPYSFRCRRCKALNESGVPA